MILRIFLTLMLVLAPLAASPQGVLTKALTGGSNPEPTPNETLIRILEDEEARTALIESLRGESAADPASAEQNAAGDEEETQGTRLANSTYVLAIAAADTVSRYWEGLKNMPGTMASLVKLINSAVLIQAARDLGVIIAATYGMLAFLRFNAKKIYFRMGQSAGRMNGIRTVALSVSSNFIVILTIILAWALGYVVMVAFSGGGETVGIRQSLYLNAFLVVESSKMIVRAVLAPLVAELRLINLSDAAARTMSRWIGAAIAILGYGHLLAVPIVDRSVSYLTGNALETIISLIVVAMAAFLVTTRRKSVAGWLVSSTAVDDKPRLRDLLAGIWYVPVLIYLAVLFIIVATRPGGFLIPILRSSGAIVLAIVLGMIVTSVLNRSIRHGVSLPEAIKQRLPALEARLNKIIPGFLALVRIIVVLAVVLVTLDVLGLTSVLNWVGVSDAGAFWTILISVTLLLAVLLAVWLAFTSWIDYRLNPDFGPSPTARETTLLTLLKNAVTIVLVIYALMFTLSELGINIAPLIASAGVLGLAIGFGAQKMVQDIITGVFIQLENAINVGDYVTVGGMSGTVEQLTIRSVSLRDPQGTFHIIPFSSVDLVSNFTRDFSYFVCDMGVGYSEDTEMVKQAMFDAFEEMNKDSDVAANVLGELEWFGLQSFGDSAIVLRARIMTRPGYQWGTGRAYNGALKKIFDERGIEIPFPHQTIYFGEDRQGNAPELKIRNVTPETG